MASWVVGHFPPHNLYVEGFGGAASVLMAKQRSAGEVYNDIDADVVNVFRVLRDFKSSKKLEKLLRLTPFSIDEYQSCFEKSDDPIESARRMIFRSFAGIGSDSIFRNCGFRYAKHNDTGTMPAESWMRYPEVINTFTVRLQGVVIHNLDVLRLIQKYDDKETLFYFDPPYLDSTRKSGSVKYRSEMGKDAEHAAFSDAVHRIKGKVVLSGYDSDLYKKIFSGWSCFKKKTIAGSGNGAGSARTECLWLSPNIQNMSMFN